MNAPAATGKAPASDPDSLAAVIAGIIAAFAPVPVRVRHDGWTPERQRAFLTALSGCGSVSRAARWAGMTARSAYRLRDRADAAGFRTAWDDCVAIQADRIFDDLVERSIHGEVVPIFYYGRQIGERRVFRSAVLLALLRQFDTRAMRAGHPAGDWLAQPESFDFGKFADV